MPKTSDIPAGTGPDSLWRQAERAVAAEHAGTPTFAERVAAAMRADLIDRFNLVGGAYYPSKADERLWAEIIDRHIREATGVR